jgi:hypothetical protein
MDEFYFQSKTRHQAQHQPMRLPLPVVELVAMEINGAAAQAGVGLTNNQIPGISPLLQMSAIAAMHPGVGAAENRPTDMQHFQSSVKRVKSLLNIETDLEAEPEPNAKRFRAAEEEPLWPGSVVSYMVGQHQLCS